MGDSLIDVVAAVECVQVCVVAPGIIDESQSEVFARALTMAVGDSVARVGRVVEAACGADRAEELLARSCDNFRYKAVEL